MLFRTKQTITAILLCVFVFSPILWAEEPKTEPVRVELVSEATKIVQGQEHWIALRFHVDSNWRLYGKDPGEIGFPPTVAWDESTSQYISDLHWPVTKKKGNSNIYDGEVWLLAKLILPEDHTATEFQMSGEVRWLACSDAMCLPGKKQVSISLPVSKDVLVKDPLLKEGFAQAFERLKSSDHALVAFETDLVDKDEETQDMSLTLATALIFAFLGGAILNLMPCVLPVISLKIFSFVKMAGENRAKVIRHGLLFTAGVVASFWVLASLLLLLRSWGHAVGWGFQLQEPLFVGILAGILFVLGMSLFGVFELGTGLSAWAGQKEQINANAGEGACTAFLSGVLATTVATPCTGPFLGSAIGFAVTLSTPAALLIFTFLGIGMAAPYLVLSFFPQLVRYVPKPGNWMVIFKEILGFFMIATVIWLTWVFGAQTSVFAIMILLFAYFLFAIASWIWGKWGAPVKKPQVRLRSGVIAFVIGMIGLYAVQAAASFQFAPEYIHHEELIAYEDIEKSAVNIEKWQVFDAEAVKKFTDRGVPVFVDFTAKWCLICQANHLVLSTAEVYDRMKDLGVVKMKADWTKSDPVITRELQKNGRSGVPLYLLYTGEPNAKPHVLPQVLTADQVLWYLEKIKPEYRVSHAD